MTTASWKGMGATGGIRTEGGALPLRPAEGGGRVDIGDFCAELGGEDSGIRPDAGGGADAGVRPD